LRYDKERGAPRVVAKGEGNVAERIVEIARESGIPVLEDRALVSLLMEVDLGKEIPPELYKAVAKVLAYVYRITGRLPKSP